MKTEKISSKCPSGHHLLKSLSKINWLNTILGECFWDTVKIALLKCGFVELVYPASEGTFSKTIGNEWECWKYAFQMFMKPADVTKTA